MKPESLDSSVVSNESADIAAPSPCPPEIERLARTIWERQGRPEGRSIEHWLEAERQLRDQDAHRSSSSKTGYDPGADDASEDRSPEEAGRATLVAGPDARAAGEETLSAPKLSNRRRPTAMTSSAASGTAVADKRKARGSGSRA